MQMLLHIPDPVAMQFKQAVPARQRSAFVTSLLIKALPMEEDPLYLAALAVEQDEQLNAEMREWRDGLAIDGLLGKPCEGDDASR